MCCIFGVNHFTFFVLFVSLVFAKIFVSITVKNKNAKPNNDKYPLKNNKTLAYHKRKNVKQNSSNKLNSKRYSISFI